MYEILGYKTQKDFDELNFILIDDGVINKDVALKHAENFLKDYEVVKIQSADREFIKVFTRDEKHNLKEFVRVRLKDAINSVFEDAHDWANTSSGDITPAQMRELDDLTDKLEKLIIIQTVQNI